MALSHYVIDLLPLRIIIKELIENLLIYGNKIEFVSRSTVYEDNNSAIVVAISPSITPKSNHSYVNYHWFSQHVGKSFVVLKIKSENQKADIFTKVLQGELLVNFIKFV